MADNLNILVVGAHPDDTECLAGGFAALCRRLGCRVCLMSMTNGNTGHQLMGGGELARRRRQEAAEAAAVIGAESLVLDVPNNGLEPTLAMRARLIEIIRQFKADVVISHRVNDYHPDHRYTGVLVQDVSYGLQIPNVCPLTPPLKRLPLFLYFSDNFRKPNPFTADLVFDLDPVFDQKVEMLHRHASQVYEWIPYDSGTLDQVPANAADRRPWLREWVSRRDRTVADGCRDLLIRKYGREKGAAIRHAEAFEISEYGGRFLRDQYDPPRLALPCFPF